MKRWVVGTIAFFAALGVGTLFVWLLLFGRSLPRTSTELQTVEQLLPNPVEVDKSEILEVFDDKIEAPETFSCQLLQTGSNFHGDQITARNGESWLGIFNEEGTFSLRPTKLIVKKVPDEFVHGPNSENKGKLTGKSVAVTDASEPIFLVKNSRQLQPGPVTTLFVGEREDWKNESNRPTYLDKNFYQTFELAGLKYELKVVKALNKRGERILALLLEGGGKRQLIHTFWTRGEGEHGEKNWLGSVGTLYWAGDLDRDNKPDFYLSLFSHMTIYEAYLLLSSEADTGDLVKKVAVFSTNGCG